MFDERGVEVHVRRCVKVAIKIYGAIVKLPTPTNSRMVIIVQKLTT